MITCRSSAILYTTYLPGDEIMTNAHTLKPWSARTFPLPPYDPEILAVEDTQHRPIPSGFHELLELRDEEPPRDEAIYNDPAISIVDLVIPGPDEQISAIVLTHKFSKAQGRPRPGILFIHGGGRVMGNVYVGLSAVSHLVKEMDAVVISVSYRLSPDHPGIAAVEDCYTSLVWMSENLATYNVDPDRFMIAGVSAGAGLVAGTALLARDRKGPRVCAQLLVCPMLDDRCTNLSSVQFEDGRGFYTAWNRYAWSCILGSHPATDGVSIYVAPGRANDLSNLPRAYIDVGSGEPFRDENISYAMKLWECGVQADLHVSGGGCHGFDLFFPTELGAEAIRTRNGWLRRILRERA